MTDLPERLAVVGTDTGVGKTVVTAGLTAWLREEGIDARAIKPVQTGHPPDDVDDAQPPARRTSLVGDAGFVAGVCGDPDAATCLEYLEEPLAPRVAAEREGVVSYRESHARAVSANSRPPRSGSSRASAACAFRSPATTR